MHLTIAVWGFHNYSDWPTDWTLHCLLIHAYAACDNLASLISLLLCSSGIGYLYFCCGFRRSGCTCQMELQAVTGHPMCLSLQSALFVENESYDRK